MTANQKSWGNLSLQSEVFHCDYHLNIRDQCELFCAICVRQMDGPVSSRASYCNHHESSHSDRPQFRLIFQRIYGGGASTDAPKTSPNLVHTGRIDVLKRSTKLSKDTPSLVVWAGDVSCQRCDHPCSFVKRLLSSFRLRSLTVVRTLAN